MKLLDISISRPAPTKPAPRRFEDGTVEVELSNGRRKRAKPYRCVDCGIEQVQHGLTARSAGLLRSQQCWGCHDAEMVERIAALAAEKIARQLLGETPAQRRYVALVLATPTWRDRAAIKEIYARAAAMTKATGIEYHVDHIYPVQSKFGCGLHVHNNMQILEKTLNIAKKNKFPLHDSPALWGTAKNRT